MSWSVRDRFLIDPSQSIKSLKAPIRPAVRRDLQSVELMRLSAFQIDRFDAIDRPNNLSIAVLAEIREHTRARETDRNGRCNGRGTVCCVWLCDSTVCDRLRGCDPSRPSISIAVGGAIYRGKGTRPLRHFDTPRCKKRGFSPRRSLGSADRPRQHPRQERQKSRSSRSAGLGPTRTHDVTTR